MQQSALIRLAAPLASLRLTAAAMAALFAAVLLTCAFTLADRGWIVPPTALLALNLCAAVMVNRRIRGSPGLMVFHLALLALCLLTGAGVLTRMHARVEVVEGAVFDPEDAQIVEQGIWHRWRAQRGAFVQGPVEVTFASGLLRQHTRSRVAVPDGGRMQEADVTDTRPLKTGGYRFSPTSNKGYALVLTWRDDAGQEISGAVHMPSFPALEWKQEQEWRTPGGEDVAFTLKAPVRSAGDASWTLRSEGAAAEVAVIAQNRPIVLRPGEWQRLRGGALRLEGVRLWLGYRIDHESFLGWMLLAATLGIAGLSLHFYRRLWRPAANPRPQDEAAANALVVRG